jgi:hypothetical protein
MVHVHSTDQRRAVCCQSAGIRTWRRRIARLARPSCLDFQSIVDSIALVLPLLDQSMQYNNQCRTTITINYPNCDGNRTISAEILIRLFPWTLFNRIGPCLVLGTKKNRGNQQSRSWHHNFVVNRLIFGISFPYCNEENVPILYGSLWVASGRNFVRGTFRLNDFIQIAK